MDCRRGVAVLIVLCGIVRTATAQLYSTVQLPTFEQFSMSTTVVVPDRGGVVAGGVNRSWQASARRGLPLLPNAHRAVDRGSVASGVSVHATVHDLEEMDQLLLDRWEERKRRKLVTKPHSRVVSTPDERPPISIGELRNRVAAEEAEETAKARADFQTGLRWQQKGRQSLAKLYFQRAFRRSVAGELRENIVSRLRLLSDTRLVSQTTIKQRNERNE